MNLPDKCNFVEYVFAKTQDSVDAGSEMFHMLLDQVKKTRNPIEKHFIRYLYKNLIYDYSNEASSVYRKVSLGMQDNLKHGYVTLFYQKEKIPFYIFPSTMSLLDKVMVSIVSFKVHINVFVNFEVQKFAQNTVFKVYISYRHEKNTDITYIESIIANALKTFK